MIDNYAKVQIAQQISRQRSITPTMVSVRQMHTSIIKVESGSVDVNITVISGTVENESLILTETSN